MQNKVQLTFLNILHMLNDGYYAVLLLFLPFIAESSNLGLDKVGVLGSVAVLGSIASGIQIFVTIPAGYFANKFGSIKILILALAIYSLSFILNIFASNFYILIFTFALAGIGFGLFHPIAFASVSRLSSVKKRGTAMANFAAFGDVGRFVFSAVITFIVVKIGWNVTSGIIGAIGIFLVVITYSIQHRYMATVEKISLKKQKFNINFNSFRKNSKFLLISIAGFIDSFGSSTLFVFLPFLLKAKGIDNEYLGSMVGVMFVGNVLGKLFLGRLVDKLKNYQVYAVAEIIMFLLIVGLVVSNNLIVIIVLTLLLGVVTKGTVPVLLSMISLSLEKNKNYEQDMSKYNFFNQSISTVAPIIIGMTAEHFGIYYGFILIASSTLVTLIPLYLFSREEIV